MLDDALILSGSGTVMLAHDTRPSAEELVKAAGSGVKALGGLPIVCGLLTTPQLHWMVCRSRGSS
jgi:phosphoacetylglucosamine mutase